jgi:hypothetical protein
MRRALPLLAVLLLALGCNNGPTDPNRVLTLTGTVEKDKPVVETVAMRNKGNMRMSLVRADLTAADGTVTQNAGLVVQIGTGTSTSCTPTGFFPLVQGSVVSLGLEKGSYCLRMSESAVLAEGAKLTYDLGLEITD